MGAHWKMTFDVSTLDHLGVKLYKQYEPIIAELISNAWDADSTEVNICLHDNTEEKKIIISDNGLGMNSEEVQNNFLKIGRNRRLAEGKNISSKFKRAILGKKGIGKLSMFGLANKIKIETIKENLLNIFEMTYSDIKKANDGNYEPSEIYYNKKLDSPTPSGTTIELSEIKRVTSFKFSPEKLASKLARRFSIFNDSNFQVNIYHNNEFIIKIENKLKYDNFKEESTWRIPEDIKNGVDDDIYEYLILNKINGFISTSLSQLPKDQQGITFISRGKLAEENVFFLERAVDFFYNYLYGEINVDFIDENDSEDNISTDRKSILWDEEKPSILKENVKKILNYIQKDWRKRRKEKKQASVQKVIKFNIKEWELELNDYEKPLAEGLINSILNNINIDTETSAKYITHIKDLFCYESFKNYSNRLLKEGLLENENVLKLLNDWEYIEAKELAKIAEGRIKTIEDFEKYINGNYSETKYIQPFFEKFPWVLDPKINSFERELTLSKAIKEQILDKEAKDANGINLLKRMDFFVTQIGNDYVIYELKTPNISISMEMLENVTHYLTFSSNFLANKEAKITVCLVTNNHKLDPVVKTFIDALVEQGKLIFTKYNDLLAIAKSYNKEILQKYQELKEKREKNIKP